MLSKPSQSIDSLFKEMIMTVNAFLNHGVAETRSKINENSMTPCLYYPL